MLIAQFNKSPLTEVVCGVEFYAPGFSSVHFGLYWQAIKERFPTKPVDRPPINEFNSLLSFSSQPNLCRVWFKSEKKEELIQVQSNRFYYNWRRQEKTDEYSFDDEIYVNFAREWEVFKKWCLERAEIPLKIVRYELTCVNTIDKDFGWHNSNDHKKVFSFVSKDLLLEPDIFNTEMEFKLKNDLGILSVNLNQRENLDNNDSLFVFLELTTKSANTDEDIKTWFEQVHKLTVSTFLALLTEEIKQEWGLVWLK